MAMPDGLVEAGQDHRQFSSSNSRMRLFELIALNWSIQRKSTVIYRTHVFCLAVLRGSGTLRTVAIDKSPIDFNPMRQPFYVRVHEVTRPLKCL